ncbi:unnamed protein product [Caretta caretta]
MCSGREKKNISMVEMNVKASSNRLELLQYTKKNCNKRVEWRNRRKRFPGTNKRRHSCNKMGERQRLYCISDRFSPFGRGKLGNPVFKSRTFGQDVDC